MKKTGFEIFLKVAAFLVVISLAVVGFVMTYRAWAIDGCAKNNRYVRTEQQDKLTHVFDETSQGPFNKCLELKNIK